MPIFLHVSMDTHNGLLKMNVLGMMMSVNMCITWHTRLTLATVDWLKLMWPPTQKVSNQQSIDCLFRLNLMDRCKGSPSSAFSAAVGVVVKTH